MTASCTHFRSGKWKSMPKTSCASSIIPRPIVSHHTSLSEHREKATVLISGCSPYAVFDRFPHLVPSISYHLSRGVTIGVNVKYQWASSAWLIFLHLFVLKLLLDWLVTLDTGSMPFMVVDAVSLCHIVCRPSDSRLLGTSPLIWHADTPLASALSITPSLRG